MSHHDYSYAEIRRLSERAAWRLEDVVGPDKSLDFDKPFMPEALARTRELSFLTPPEQRVLNQIRGHSYLRVFIVFEEFVVPFLLDDIRKGVADSDEALRTLLQFANEETKHTQIFKWFAEDFRRGFPQECGLIGPSHEIGAYIRGHDALAVGLLLLATEWSTQAHYLQCVRDDQGIDPQFKSLLRHHWIEESQHTKADTLIVEKLAAQLSPEQRNAAFEQYLALCTYLDGGFSQQAALDVASFELAAYRTISEAEHEELLRVQRKALRYTFLESAMEHPRFTETLQRLDAGFAGRVTELARSFA